VTCIATGAALAESDAVAFTTTTGPGQTPIVVVDHERRDSNRRCHLAADAAVLEDVFARGLLEDALGLGRPLTVREKALVRQEVTDRARVRMNLPLSHAEARALALAIINPVPPPDPAPHVKLPGEIEPMECVLLDQHTLEREWGWVFFYGAADGELLIGNGPLFVNRHDASIELQGSGLTTAEYLEEYEGEL
tara:strand:+ start:965 stop:1543 length:579 start_codon:yes stop_codon:yes gene_type:complete